MAISSLSEKKNPISFSAFSSQSEPCTAFSCTFVAKSFLIVPNSASSGFVDPIVFIYQDNINVVLDLYKLIDIASVKVYRYKHDSRIPYYLGNFSVNDDRRSGNITITDSRHQMRNQNYRYELVLKTKTGYSKTIDKVYNFKYYSPATKYNAYVDNFKVNTVSIAAAADSAPYLTVFNQNAIVHQLIAVIRYDNLWTPELKSNKFDWRPD